MAGPHRPNSVLENGPKIPRKDNSLGLKKVFSKFFKCKANMFVWTPKLLTREGKEGPSVYTKLCARGFDSDTFGLILSLMADDPNLWIVAANA